MGPIDPNEDNRRTVHVSQPNTTRQGLWIGPHVFHMRFDTIDVRVNTKRIYHRRLYTLHFLAFGHDKSGLLSSIWVLFSARCACKRLLLSSLFMLPQWRYEMISYSPLRTVLQWKFSSAWHAIPKLSSSRFSHGKLKLANSSWCVWTAQKHSANTLANRWRQI